MHSGPKSYILPVLLALLLHGGLVVLTASTWFESSSDSHRVVPQHIKAELVDLRSQNKAKEDALKQAEANKRAAAKSKAEAKKLADTKAKVEAKKRSEQKAKAERNAKQEQLKKAAADKKAQQLAADIKLKKAAKDKATKDRAVADQLALAKKQDELKKAEQKRQADAQRRADQAEKERQAREQAQRLEEERLEAEAKEQQARAAAAKEQVAAAKDIIAAAVQSQWSRPPSARNGMEVGVRIHLLPTGEVDDAYVTKSSGDDAFDRSAVNAVLKAERFPELQGIDPVVFDRDLRRISLSFRPETLRR